MGNGKKYKRNRISDNELRRYVKLLSFPVLALLLIVIVLVSRTLTGDEEIKVLESQTAETEGSGETRVIPIEPDNKEYTQAFDGNLLMRDEIPEINRLMESYFQAMTDCDVDTFNGFFTSGDVSQAELFKKSFEEKKNYIEGYQNIACYTAAGPTEGYWIVYAYYETKYKLAATPAPAMIHCYVKKDEGKGYLIYDGEMTGELQAYLDQVDGGEDAVLLAKQVDRQFEEAAEADEDLRRIVELYRKGPPVAESQSQ